VAPSPREAAAGADVLISCVSDPPALEDVMLGEEGAAEGLRTGSIWVDCSTVSPALERKLAAMLEKRGEETLDAPITGGTWGAEKAELVFMAGGKADVLEKVRPVLMAMGKQVFLMGDHGTGQATKLGVNLIMAVTLGAFCEADALIARAGIDREQMLTLIQSSMARAGIIDIKAPLIFKSDFRPSFPLRLMHKDLGLALELANQLQVPMPITAAARELFSATRALGHSDADYSVIAKFFESA
jgi:3-hydroxyisobutyrate dehydrogenase-like beta-hydroxyacid dehydrogenase